MVVRVGSLVALGLLLVTSGNARAQSEPASRAASSPPLVEVGLAGFGRYDFGTFCEQDLDVVSCSSGRVFAGPQVTPRLRLSRLVSLGMLGAFGWGLGSEGQASGDGSRSERTLTTYRLEGEARLHPLDPNAVDLWFGADFGVTALRDAWTSYAPNGDVVGATTNTDVGAILGVAVGVDVRLGDFVALGPELRAAWLSYDEPQGFVALALSGTFLGDP